MAGVKGMKTSSTPKGPRSICRICHKPKYAKELDDGLVCRECRERVGNPASIDKEKMKRTEYAQAQARVSLAIRALQDICGAVDLTRAGQEQASALKREIERIAKEFERVYW